MNEEVQSFLEELFSSNELNRLPEAYGGGRIFDTPLIGVSRGDDHIFNKFIENMPEYWDETNAMKKDQMKKDAFGKWIAFLLIRNSNQAKYGSLKSGLISQYSMGHDQYPKTIMAATDILLNHRHNNCKKWKDP